MNYQDQQTAIARTCPNVFGIRMFSSGKSQIVWKGDEDFPGPVATVNPISLDGMHSAEKTLTSEEHKTKYMNKLFGLVGPDMFDALNATALQRAEAFLRTFDLWLGD